MLLRESVNARIDVNQPKCPSRPPLLLILSLTCPKRKKKETHHERYSPTHTELAIFKSNFCKNNAILANFFASISPYFMQTVILNLNIQNPPRREMSTYQSVSILWKGSESIFFVINSFTWRHMHHYNSNLKNNCYFPAYKSYNYDAINNRCCFVTIWIRYERVFRFPFLYFLFKKKNQNEILAVRVSKRNGFLLCQER